MTTRIVFDVKLKRPACVLLQAAYGADSAVAHKFPVKSWLTFPTEDMHLFNATDDEMGKLVEMVKGNAK